MAPMPVTLNGLEGHSQVPGLFKCNSLTICKISPDSVLARSLCIRSGLLIALIRDNQISAALRATVTMI